MLLGDAVPDFEAESTDGPLSLYDHLGSGWGLLSSHVCAFHPVCTSELASLQFLLPEFTKREVKVIALCADAVEPLKKWLPDVVKKAKGGNEAAVAFPIVADKEREVAMRLGLIAADAPLDEAGMPLMSRTILVVDPDRRVRLTMTYPTCTGRNYAEVLRVVDSLQLAARAAVATPAGWNVGEKVYDKVLLLPVVKDDAAKKMFPKGVVTAEMPSGGRYMRWVKP